MKHKMLQRMLTVGTLAIASLVMTAAAHATVVTYDFEAKVTTGSSAFFGKTVTGSFSYEDSNGSAYNLKVDKVSTLEKNKSLSEVVTGNKLTMQTPQTGQFSAGYSVNFKDSKGQDAGKFWSDLQLTKQTTSSLALGGGAVGTLQMGGGLQLTSNPWYVDFVTVTATLTKLEGHGASTPELDPRSGAGALGLLLGGLGMVFARRRSSK